MTPTVSPNEALIEEWDANGISSIPATYIAIGQRLRDRLAALTAGGAGTEQSVGAFTVSEQPRVIKDLAMLIRRLCWKISKLQDAPDSLTDLSTAAMNLLIGRGLQGSPFREEAAALTPQPAWQPTRKAIAELIMQSLWSPASGPVQWDATKIAATKDQADRLAVALLALFADRPKEAPGRGLLGYPPEAPRVRQPSLPGHFWLWRNGDHWLAFDSEYPEYPNGDPRTLGEPEFVLSALTPAWQPTREEVAGAIANGRRTWLNHFPHTRDMEAFQIDAILALFADRPKEPPAPQPPTGGR